MILKLLVGVVLIGIALGIGIPLYLKFGGAAGGQLDFSVSCSSPEYKDNFVKVTVDVESVVGYEGNVELSATGESEIVKNASFSPRSGDVPFGSTLTINIENAPTGSHTITVKGKSEDGVTKKDTFELTIE